jgi:transcriptional regulator with XRE-family HTH domain
MILGEKLRYLRLIEGTLRGLERPMTQGEVSRAIASELGESLSQAYLSQIEGGSRPHLTNRTRMLLARFFQVHPGYLVDDPEGYHQELVSPVRTLEDKLDLWLIQGAERFTRDRDLRRALLAVAQHPRSRECLLLLHGIVETPSLAERLFEILAPDGLAPNALVPESAAAGFSRAAPSREPRASAPARTGPASRRKRNRRSS